ncbi:MAG: efflux RND transporter permease subunit, partial [Thiohalocapsa sp.]
AAAVLDGRFIGDYRLSDAEVDIKLGIDPAFLSSPERALEIPLLEHPSGPVRLGDIVRPVPEIQPSELTRYRGNRSRSITANIRPGAPISAASVVAWARAHQLDLRERYPAASLIFGGEFEETQRSFQSLTQAFGLALILIYLILAAQFRSYLQPLIVLAAVVFSIIGVVFGKLVTQSLFTINSFIAVVGVTGVVVNDSLVLIDFINRLYRAGLSRADAIRQGLAIRLRPIVLTTLTTTLGLLPMALGVPRYSIVWGSMASTFVTGLATATLLTLFIVPVGWDLIAEAQERRVARRRAAQDGTLGGQGSLNGEPAKGSPARERSRQPSAAPAAEPDATGSSPLQDRASIRAVDCSTSSGKDAEGPEER